ncbi:hypothetical protein [Planctopirus hydrillae]|nr:hypothetical protein [Planctopirus hydrillae]
MTRLLVVVKSHDNPATSWPGHPQVTPSDDSYAKETAAQGKQAFATSTVR